MPNCMIATLSIFIAFPKGLYSIKVVINAAKILDCDIPTVTLPVQTNYIISKCSRIIKNQQQNGTQETDRACLPMDGFWHNDCHHRRRMYHSNRPI